MRNEIQNLSVCNEAIQLKKNIEKNFLMLGQYLMNIRDNKLYVGSWEAFHDFLEEMNITDSTASKMINIYKKFVIEYQIAEDRVIEAGGWTKLAVVLPLVNSSEDAEYWIDQSVILTSRDLAKEVKEHKTGIDMRYCKHGDTYLIRKCRECGEYWEVPEND